MSDPAKFDIAVQRNEDYGPIVWKLTDIDGAIHDLTGWSFTFGVMASFDQAAPDMLLNAGTSDGYIKLLDAQDGSFELFIARERMAGLPGPIDADVPFAFNILAIKPGDKRQCIARGTFIAEPGV